MFLEVHGLCAGYQHGSVLDGVELELERGQSLALLGRNGVGKTTLVLTLMGLLRARAGSVRLDGQELSALPAQRVARAGVALVPQGRRIWPTLSVREHLELSERAARPRGVARRWTQAAIHELLPRLAERRDQLAGQLSGGEQQMLALARALLCQPSLLLLDEPSEGLAPLVVDQIGGVLRSLASEGLTLLLVEQDLHLAFGVAREVAVLARGKLVHRCATLQFRRDPHTARRLLGVDVSQPAAARG
jgi:branched-chain amino acid transport system ATP-binding protein